MDAFLKCSGCGKVLFAAEFEQNLRVCPYCGLHHKLTADARIAVTFDPESFVELDQDLRSTDPLKFPEYAEKLAASVAKTGRNDGIVSGTGLLMGIPVSIAVSDFSFMGGSMGSVAGEKIARTLERSAEQRIAAVIFCASGGARMQEGIVSLMQMAKTTGAAERCRVAGVPYIAVFTDPTMAGVLASYASVADVILAEPGAMVGFAGARVSKQAQVSMVPTDFQRAEFAQSHGQIDRIVPRSEMRDVLGALVRLLGGAKAHAG